MSGFDPQRRQSMIGPSSRNSSAQSNSNNNYNMEISSELKVGARAQVQGKIGLIRFVGTTSFQTGKWVGIELDEPQGKNSGVVQGKRYFECRTNHGVFVRPSQVKVLSEEGEDEGEEIPFVISPSQSSTNRFAPAQDPNLAAARTIQQHLPTSSSSTLLPSRITSPSRISRLPSTNNTNSIPTKKPTALNRKSASPTASLTLARKSKVGLARPRSDTLKDVKENKLLQLRLQQQERIALQQQQLLQQQQQQQEELEQEEEEAELQRQLQEEEELAAADAAAAQLEQQRQQEEEEEEEESYESESVGTNSDVGLVSTTSSTALPTRHHQQPSYGSLAANLPISKSDQMIPLKDYEELRLKLKILESKRQEDRERYREHEKIKEEAEQFLTLRNKLQGKKDRMHKKKCIN